MKKKGLIIVLIALFCLFFVGTTKVSAAEDVTISFANTSQRVSLSTTKQVWQNNLVTLTHEKSSSSNDIVDYSNPIRFYANSKLTVSVSEDYVISKIVFDCNNSTYATTLKNSISSNATVSSDKVTVTAIGSNTYVVAKLSGQVRMDSLTVTLESASTPTVTITGGNSMEVRGQLSFGAELSNVTGEVIWNSSNPAVATIDSNGVLTGVSTGTTKVSATCNGVKSNEIEVSVYSDADNLRALVKGYYGSGEYTKKSNVYLTAKTESELESYFHVTTISERTTYYKGDALWMSRGPESEGVQYSYYGTKYNNDEEPKAIGVTNATTSNPLEEPANPYVVLSGAGKNSMEEYYVTLYDMAVENVNYFNGWNYISENHYEYKLPEILENGENSRNFNNSDETFLSDFLAFTAPCVLENVFKSEYISKAGIVLSVNEVTNGNFGPYLSLKIKLHSSDSGKTENGDCVLSEARIYKDNMIFDENNVTVVAAKQLGKGTITMPVTLINKVVGSNGYDYTFEDNNGDLVLVNGDFSGLSLGQSCKITATIKSINGNTLEFNKTGASVSEITGEPQLETITTDVKSILDHKVSIGQPVNFTAVVTEIVTTGSKGIKVQDVNGKEILLYNCTSEVEVQDIVEINGYVGAYNLAYQINSAVCSASTNVTDNDKAAYAKLFVNLPEFVVEDFDLPISACGVTISWVSSNQNYIKVSGNQAQVTRSTDEDKTVFLTPSYNGIAGESFAVVVKANTVIESKLLAEFKLGANGNASHSDGSEKTSYSESANGYTLSLTNVAKMYTGARDAKGNSCIKLGTGDYTGGFTFNVPADVNKVVIYVAKYNTQTGASYVSINGQIYQLTSQSSNGDYLAIEIDTTTTKTIKLESGATGSVAKGKRCMINTIEFWS